ncbi:hypothetical protein DVK07_04880 [Halorubrum sp. Atlit-26R]|nr:hypothetical protein DVK07_04880 [Halorubrum sp. Atlit-26R]
MFALRFSASGSLFASKRVVECARERLDADESGHALAVGVVGVAVGVAEPSFLGEHLENGDRGELDGQHSDERGVREDGERDHDTDGPDHEVPGGRERPGVPVEDADREHRGQQRATEREVDAALPLVVAGGPEPTLGREQGDDHQRREPEEAARRDGERDEFEHRIQLDRRQF